MDAALESADGHVITISSSGFLDAPSTTHPGASRQIPWVRSLRGNVAAVASGVAAALAMQGRSHVRVLAQGSDRATTDIGFGCLSGMFDRDDDVLYICYDSEAGTNASARRYASTPAAARRSAISAGEEPGDASRTGKTMPVIAMAHAIPYVATASVSDLPDLRAKVATAMTLRGARYLHVHAPCPAGSGCEDSDIVAIARLAVQSGLFPLFEAHYGRITRRTTLRAAVPVAEYLSLQKRVARPFAANDDASVVAHIQAIADRNIRDFALRDEHAEGEPAA